MQSRPRKLLDQVRHTIRLKHYSSSTEETYVSWIKRYIFFHDKRHPQDMGIAEVEAFLTHLAVEQRVASSTQNQALNALLFLYHQVLGIKLEGQITHIRAKKRTRLPTVLTREETLRVIDGPNPGLFSSYAGRDRRRLGWPMRSVGLARRRSWT